MNTLVALCLLQFLGFLMATVDIRAIATRRYRWVLVTNFSIPVISFALTKVIVVASWAGAIAMGCGGAVAAVVGIALTEHWSDHDDVQ